MSARTIEGGCACGSIRYSATDEPGFSFLCQCRDCQKATGTGHSAAFMLSREATTISGTMNWYRRVAPSSNIIEQGFCGKCGSPIMNRNSGHANVYFVHAGSLDEPNNFKPQKVVHRESGLEFDLKDPES